MGQVNLTRDFKKYIELSENGNKMFQNLWKKKQNQAQRENYNIESYIRNKDLKSIISASIIRSKKEVKQIKSKVGRKNIY